MTAKVKARQVSSIAGPLAGLSFWCPGCDEPHGVSVRTANQTEGWEFNGDYEKPTLSPSVLLRVNYKDGTCFICHSFVRDGQIQFLGDCTHYLANQTVELPEVDHA